MTSPPINENDDEVIGGLIGGAGGDPLEYSVYEDTLPLPRFSQAPKNRLWDGEDTSPMTSAC